MHGGAWLCMWLTSAWARRLSAVDRDMPTYWMDPSASYTAYTPGPSQCGSSIEDRSVMRGLEESESAAGPCNGARTGSPADDAAAAVDEFDLSGLGGLLLCGFAKHDVHELGRETRGKFLGRRFLGVVGACVNLSMFDEDDDAV